MLSQFTIVDWAILAFPALFLLVGINRGGIAILLSRLARFLVALVLAQIPVLYVQLRTDAPGTTARWLNLDLNTARIIVGIVVFLASMLVIMRLLAFLRGILQQIFGGNALGRLLDQILGIPAGLAVGFLLSLLLVVLPVSQIKAHAGRKFASIERSVLQPPLERRVFGYVRAILGRGTR